ncbi:SprT-like family-domain-containing protein [Fennellomyces sp. T-0311]|nr:SprT-like family-domain-containing protein [Fennellomyces sp. T-0311]
MSDSETDEDEAFARRLQEQEESCQQYDYDADLALARELQEQEMAAFDTQKIDADLALARALQDQATGSSSSKPIVIDSTTPDPDNELYDPTPDLHQLFLAFDRQYFKGQLASVEVKWSTRMTLCAGLCCYFPGGHCVIKLSEPLLKYRSREDMINTLLHEMIHALLFIQIRNDDHDGHGPEFLREADRINSTAGTNITVYHKYEVVFHDEVDHYRRHVWQCNGPCRDRPPPPQKADSWYAEHQMTCGGTYTKISEPEGYKSKKKRPVSKITDFFFEDEGTKKAKWTEPKANSDA